MARGSPSKCQECVQTRLIHSCFLLLQQPPLHLCTCKFLSGVSCMLHDACIDGGGPETRAVQGEKASGREISKQQGELWAHLGVEQDTIVQQPLQELAQHAFESTQLVHVLVFAHQLLPHMSQHLSQIQLDSSHLIHFHASNPTSIISASQTRALRTPVHVMLRRSSSAIVGCGRVRDVLECSNKTRAARHCAIWRQRPLPQTLHMPLFLFSAAPRQCCGVSDGCLGPRGASRTADAQRNRQPQAPALPCQVGARFILDVHSPPLPNAVLTPPSLVAALISQH